VQFLVKVKSQGLFFEFDHFDRGQRSEYRIYWCATPLYLIPVFIRPNSAMKYWTVSWSWDISVIFELDCETVRLVPKSWVSRSNRVSWEVCNVNYWYFCFYVVKPNIVLNKPNSITFLEFNMVNIALQENSYPGFLHHNSICISQSSAGDAMEKLRKIPPSACWPRLRLSLDLVL